MPEAKRIGYRENSSKAIQEKVNPFVTQQLLTPYQSQYYAWLLTRRAASDTVESLASTLVDSQVDFNPHQVEAALFACKNPLSRGVILADEVGLGKTIEAGLVISQRWAERRRRLLICAIHPAKQGAGLYRVTLPYCANLQAHPLAAWVTRQDEVEAQRNDLITQLEEQTLFTIEWELK